MKRILPDGKDGVVLTEVSVPELFENSALCRTTHSLISSGTERGIIQACQGKSLDEIIRLGVQLGYTGAGIVEETKGEAVQEFQKGQRVAYYGGPWVSHSEQVVIPKPLLFPLPDSVSSEQGSFIGIGAIAMHGFRQGRVGLGETCWIAGAGLIGNLCAQLALLAGCRVVVSDTDNSRLQLFKDCRSEGEDYLTASPDNVESTIQNFSHQQGADAIFLCMGGTSSEPLEQAIRFIRPGGKIVILGTPELQIPREEFFYKEAEITISRAAGPGRYSMDYEKQGIDYPVQYVRWTEGRNLAEVLRLIAAERLIVNPLISRKYSLQQIHEAYAELTQAQPSPGILITWD